MNKGIELIESQIKAFENGATYFMFPIDFVVSDPSKIREDELEWSFSFFDEDTSVARFEGWGHDDGAESFVDFKALIQKGDKDIFIKEEFIYNFDKGFQLCGDLYYKADAEEEGMLNSEWTPASQMTKEQSRYSFKECIDVRVVRVQDMSISDMYNCLGVDYKFPSEEKLIYTFVEQYNNQMQEQNTNRTYSDDDYIFLCEFRRIR